MKMSRGQTANSHVLSTFGMEPPGKDFLVAYLDFSKGPETEMWLYSSIENTEVPGDEIVCEQQILKLFAKAREIEKSYQGQRETPEIVLVGALHEWILEILEKHSMVKTKTSEHFKFIFKMEDLPVGKPLPYNLSWSSVRPSDMPLVLSRTAIPYKESESSHRRYGHGLIIWQGIDEATPQCRHCFTNRKSDRMGLPGYVIP